MQNTFTKVVAHLSRLPLPKPKAKKVDLSGRTVIVTGASPGSLGYETARILATWGARVVATSPHKVAFMKESLQTDLRRTGADPNNISVHALDLCDPHSVDGFVTWYRETHGNSLQVLVNNAGIHKNIFTPSTRPPLTRDGFEIHWRTNYLGTFHLTHALLPLLQQGGLESGDARVVNVASHLHDRGKNKYLFEPAPSYNSWEAYGKSKLALIHHSFELQRRFSGTSKIRSVALHPGSVNTNLTQRTEPRGNFGKMVWRFSSAMSSLVLLSRPAGAQTIVHCASTSSLQGGCYYYRCDIAEVSNESMDGTVSRRLWEETHAWVGSLCVTGNQT